MLRSESTRDYLFYKKTKQNVQRYIEEGGRAFKKNTRRERKSQRERERERKEKNKEKIKKKSGKNPIFG